MRVHKFWKGRVSDSAIDELTVRLEKIESDHWVDSADSEWTSELQRRLEKIESDLSSSWALRPREEYEKRVLGGMRHEIKEYLAKVAAATFIFLGGVGYVLIDTKTVATYHREATNKYEKVLNGLRAEFRELKEQSKATDEWQAVHNLGVLYRFAIDSGLYKIQRNDSATPHEQQKLIAKLINTARGHFEKALQKDGTNPSTHWELGNLYYFIPTKEKLRYLVDEERAVRHFERAAQSYKQAEINQGYRADTYQRLAEIGRVLYLKETGSAGKKQMLDRIRDCYRKAQSDYEAMEKPLEWVPGELEKIRGGLEDAEEKYLRDTTGPAEDV